AENLKAGMLNGKILINMDSETEGELYVGCAGGVDVNVSKNYREVAAPEGYEAYKLYVSGLNGGHSGMDINIGRANANKLLIRFLSRCIYKMNFELAEIKGGDMRNAIPREAYAIIMVPKAEAKVLKAEVANYEKIYKNEFAITEKSLSFTVEKVKKAPEKVVPHKAALDFIKAIFVCPNGVIRMSDSMPGLVETSSNLAIVECKGGKFTVKCLTRSSVNTAKEGTMYKIGTVFEMIGAKVEFTGAYPGWNPNMESPILKVMKAAYKKLYKAEPKIMAIHAGLECGLFGSVYDWDMVSAGPTIEHPHSPVERVNIESVEKFWKLTIEALKNVPKK
ncbi:MAG: beta-Ala-His dipeptidase, partial [Bacteroidales bacterium]|nr:beta-Ala-His dipeptidase [Bacteroidales bacterium]